jgi:hypothetical protein
MIPKHSCSLPDIRSVYRVVLMGSKMGLQRGWNEKITYACTEHNKASGRFVCEMWISENKIGTVRFMCFSQHTFIVKAMVESTFDQRNSVEESLCFVSKFSPPINTIKVKFSLCLNN